MKHVVITGSTRGIGYHLALHFLHNHCKVTISGTTEAGVESSVNQLLEAIPGSEVQGFVADVTQLSDVDNLWNSAVENFGSAQIWINNAGIDQSALFFEKLDPEEYEKIIRINVLGTMHGSTVAIRNFKAGEGGQLYNMAGFGSNGQMMKRMTLYGTSKRAVQYFTKSLAKENRGTAVKIGLISPGMVMTDMIYDRIGDYPDPENVKKIFNILADKPETVCPWIVGKILANRKNGKHISWINNLKVSWRFMTSAFNRRNFFD